MEMTFREILQKFRNTNSLKFLPAKYKYIEVTSNVEPLNIFLFFLELRTGFLIIFLIIRGKKRPKESLNID